MGDEHLTPGMRQYMEVKRQHPDCIVMFRMGDFYEMFYSDAKTAAKELNITLTTRGKGEKKAPLAGIPFHSVQPYIARLVKKGYKICMVEQVEDPKKAKGLVKRDVVRIITPGTLVEEDMLPQASNNFIAALNKEGNAIALALSDISTGSFSVLQTTTERLDNELAKYQPSEIILPLSLEQAAFTASLHPHFLNFLDDVHYFPRAAHALLEKQCKTLPNMSEFMTSAAGALLAYLHNTQKNNLRHLSHIDIINTDEYMLLDRTTLTNLDILGDEASLYNVLNHTKTRMGTRMLKQWLLRPLMHHAPLEKRLDAVEELAGNLIMKDALADVLDQMQDIERLISRITLRTASPKDLVGLRNTLALLPELNKIKSHAKSTLLVQNINEFSEQHELLKAAIQDEPNTSVREGNIIRDGYNKELDELRGLKRTAKDWLISFEEQEKKKTGIKYLKVRYNKVFGYFIEVSKSNLALVPETYIRKQTQVNAERFITPELKEKEHAILTADDRITELEYKLFMEILAQLDSCIEEIRKTSMHLAQIDVLQSFATAAVLYTYVRPNLLKDDELCIINGRHPIVERQAEQFVSNDIHLKKEQTDTTSSDTTSSDTTNSDTTNSDTTSMMIITGPNMAGKSVYIKQNALIVLMAQIGSFVPAESAKIGIVDRIFSRVGASDDIASGHSTFMVEMTETANILANATSKSFIILDEIGRGTSTYDGVSLAWAIAEYIVTTIKAKTLFATHYHQLNRMAEQYEGVKNFNIAVSEKEDAIIFLRKIVEGGTDRSYGIHVAKLAGLPKEVIDRSKKIITQLEMEDEIGEMLHKDIKKKKPTKPTYDAYKPALKNEETTYKQRTLFE